ncbi:hypothetical protein LCGC14_0377170 [marine sediment metagenome]|uniref:Coil containing protein n=1 Tax=marine sediment metagenome TaxID=412755 RepID=A0A0F9VQV8_9ZZZZ
METKEIAESEVVDAVDMPMELSVFDPLKAKIREAKEKSALLAFDYKDKQGNKDARSWVAYLRTLKAPVSELHKTGKAEALKYCKEWDRTKNDIITGIEEMIEFHDKPLREIKDAEKKAAEEIEARGMQEEICEQEAKQAEFDAEQAKLTEKQAKLDAKEAEFDRKEREARIAEEAKKKAKAAVEQVLIDTEKRRLATIAKAEQTLRDAENKRQRQEEAAALAAVNAENACKQALVDAENRRIADVQRAKDEAAAKTEEREQALRQERRAEESRLAEQEAAKQLRIANIDHRRKIHQEILVMLTGMGMTEDFGKTLITAVASNRIPHTKIEY